MTRMDYSNLISMVLKEGDNVPSRFGDTREVVGLNWTSIPGVVPLRRGHNRVLGYMELLQVMAGVFDDSLMADAAPNAAHALFTSQMAGGPRVADQPARAIELLQREPASRQAVVFWGNAADSFSSNLPCTLCLQLLLRDGRLHAIASMRSWDLVRGLPYDLTIFGGIQMTVAQILGATPGTLSVNAGSAHVYKKDLEQDRLPIGKSLVFRPEWIPGTTWDSVRSVCLQVARDLGSWVDRCPPIIDQRVEADGEEGGGGDQDSA